MNHPASDIRRQATRLLDSAGDSSRRRFTIAREIGLAKRHSDR